MGLIKEGRLLTSLKIMPSDVMASFFIRGLLMQRYLDFLMIFHCTHLFQKVSKSDFFHTLEVSFCSGVNLFTRSLNTLFIFVPVPMLASNLDRFFFPSI